MSDSHNAAIYPLLKSIVAAEPTQSGQWVLLETLCLGIGRLHGHSDREIAIFVETIAERLTEGARS